MERVCFGVLMHGLCGGIEGLLRWRVACRGMWVMIVGGECGEWVVSVGDYGDAVVIFD